MTTKRTTGAGKQAQDTRGTDESNPKTEEEKELPLPPPPRFIPYIILKNNFIGIRFLLGYRGDFRLRGWFNGGEKKKNLSY